ncbi:hypothetical protein BAE44_0017496 [Dichanthelium oligosanthes]|uniref:N-alpha-acetyltransferase 40 n=1 Tax=Dichanthelium oligosanthes TaxID=888268 RepID=A0A1E5V8Y4_9POAL|nr:hypothetical protein BAE44_0017496 [Dichanthelium oligosanthes]
MATAEKKRPQSSSGAGMRPNRKEVHLFLPPLPHPSPPLLSRAGIGLSVYLESGRGDRLTLPMRKYIQNLLKVNMEEPYGPEWPSEEKVKRQEMVVPDARYILVKQYSNGFTTECSMNQSVEGRLVGFVHYRFVLEEELPVVYVYELQMEPSAQGKGLGKFLMQLIEQIACKNQMGAVMLTVQKANTQAMAFYSKLRYVISSTSPSRVDPQIGLEKSYKILCKTFDSKAKSKLEVCSVLLHMS